MTVRRFDGVDDVIAVEPMSPIFTGFGTLAVLWRGSDATDHGLVCGEASGFARWEMLPVGGDEVYVDYIGFSAINTWSANEWYLSIAAKPTGSSVCRAHSFRYSTGVWTHANRGTLNDETAGSHTSILFGHTLTNNFWLAGDIAVVGVWPGVVLSDAECETLETELANWLALSPGGLWAFDQPSTSDPVLDLSGNAHDQISITGTSIVTGDDPPGFNFSLTSDTHFYRQGGIWVPTTRKVRQAGAWVEVP